MNAEAFEKYNNSKSRQALWKAKGLAEFKEHFGEEYPAAMVFDGVRLPLREEHLFIRIYQGDDEKSRNRVCRFQDGSASINLSELQNGWPKWKQRDRRELSWHWRHLKDQPDFLEVLRHIMRED